MNNKYRFIEELYMTFQIALSVILLNSAFPLFGSYDGSYFKILSLSYFGFMLYRVYKIIMLFTTDKFIEDKNKLLTGLIEGIFLLAFVILKIDNNLPLSNIVFAYVLIQTIRFPLKKRYYFVLVGLVIEGYLFFMSGMTLENLKKLGSNGLLIFFISYCISIVLKEFYKLQEENEHYVDELETLNSKLMELSSTDYLTGLYNHKSFYLTIKNFEQYENGKYKSLCMALIDIDNFKNINDTYGHLAGDKILSNLAKIMKKKVRETDFLARYGGEEFVIVLPGISLKQAEKICERLRKTVESNQFEVEGHLINITVSMGLSRLDNFGNKPVEKFIKLVDELLYTAKNSGKNCIISEDYSQQGF